MDTLAEALQDISLHSGTGTGTTDGPVADFFEGYEFSRFTYDPRQPPEAEFNRLCIARQWGQRRIDIERAIFREAVRQEARTLGAGQTQQIHHASIANSPLQIFFMQNVVNGYTYHGRTPIVEWKRLLQAKSWTFRQCKVDGSEQHALYVRYLEAVEEEVDYLVEQNEEVREGGIEPWEYLCQLFGVGVPPLSKSRAKKLLASTHVNIYDFIDHQRRVRAGQQAAIHTYPTVRRLAEYSRRTKRIYPREAAKADGTLKFLLKTFRVMGV